ncbi:extracellular solute-binding protein [Microlunatus soli]|nr:extracellular solute-binding protein [Microlunatus soli]
MSRRSFVGSTIALGAAAASGGLLAGCSSGGGPVREVSFWSQLAGSKREAGEALGEAFAAAHPRVRVRESLYGSPDQLNQKLLTGIIGGTLPDLFIQHWDYSLIYASGDRLADLSGLVPNASRLTDRFANYSRLGGKLVSAPLYGTSRALTINVDIAAEAGLDVDRPPTDWDELRGWAKELTRWDGDKLLRAGLHLYANDLELYEAFTLFVQGAGGRVLTEDGTDVAFDSDAGVAAVEFMAQLVIKDRVTVPGFGIGDSSSAPFPSGRAGFAINGNYGLTSAKKGKINVAVALMPCRDGGYTSMIDPFAFAIPAKAASRQGAARFIDFALSEEQQIRFAAVSRNIPATATAAASPAIKKDKLLARFVEAADHAPEHGPVTPAETRMIPVIARSVADVFYRRSTPATAVRSAAAKIRPFVQVRS